MAPPTRSTHGITVIELLVLIVVIGFLVSLAFPGATSTSDVRNMQCVNYARQIHIAATCVAKDGESNGDPSLAWPGDLKAEGHITNVGDFVNVLVRNYYMKPDDLKIFSLSGFKAYPGGKPEFGQQRGAHPCVYRGKQRIQNFPGQKG